MVMLRYLQRGRCNRPGTALLLLVVVPLVVVPLVLLLVLLVLLVLVLVLVLVPLLVVVPRLSVAKMGYRGRLTRNALVLPLMPLRRQEVADPSRGAHPVHHQPVRGRRRRRRRRRREKWRHGKTPAAAVGRVVATVLQLVLLQLRLQLLPLVPLQLPLLEAVVAPGSFV